MGGGATHDLPTGQRRQPSFTFRRPGEWPRSSQGTSRYHKGGGHMFYPSQPSANPPTTHRWGSAGSSEGWPSEGVAASRNVTVGGGQAGISLSLWIKAAEKVAQIRFSLPLGPWSVIGVAGTGERDRNRCMAIGAIVRYVAQSARQRGEVKELKVLDLIGCPRPRNPCSVASSLGPALSEGPRPSGSTPPMFRCSHHQH